MGDGQLIQVPISDGIDQRASAVVGPFRAQRFERARYLQPGEAVVSPGYAYAAGTIDATNKTLRAVGYHRTFGAYAVYSGLLSTGFFGAFLARRDYDMTWHADETSRVSPVEAPRRIKIDINQDATTAIPPQVITTERPDTVVIVTSERVSVMCNNQMVKSRRFTGASGNDGVFLRAAGRAMFDKVGSIWTYDLNADTWTRNVSRSGTFDFVTAVYGQPAFGVPGQTGYGAAVHATGTIRVYSWNGSAFTLLGAPTSADLPTAIGNIGDISVTISGTYLVRACVDISSGTKLGFRLYNLPGVSATPEYTYNVYPGFSQASPISLCDDAQGDIWAAFTETNNSAHYGYVSAGRLVFTSGGVSGYNQETALFGLSFTGLMFPAPNTRGVFVAASRESTTLWLVDGTSATGTYQWPDSSATLATWWGFGEGHTARAQVVCSAVESQYDGLQSQQVLIPYLSDLVSIGNCNANELVSLQLGKAYSTALIPCSGSSVPSSAISPVDTFQRAGDVVGGGYPFAVGNRIDSAGLSYQPSQPVVLAATGPLAAFGSMSDGVYQYVKVLETLDSMGNIIRSMPSDIGTVTLSGGTTNQAVNVFFAENPPQLPGVDSGTSRWVIYRTTASGTVFHNVSKGSYFSAYTDVGFTDKLSDSDIASLPILYSQGQNGAVSGQKPNYAIPPCRCIWQGRDRYIVGGLENPRRVRLSKLFQDGERAQFTHPSEAQWSVDVEDDVIGVAQLDEAWLVLCQSSIYAFFGAGPDDTGAGGEFEVPRCISRQIGCHSWRSLCEIPEGLLFQGQDSIIYLVMRGTLQVVSFSEKVRNLLVNIATGQSLGWVSAVVRHETRGTLHFVRNTGAPLVYNTVTSSWSVDTDWVSDGLTGAISACQARVRRALPTGQQYTESFPTVYLATTGGRIIYEGCNDGADMSMGPSGAVHWRPFVESNDMALFGLMGWGETPIVSLMFGHGYNTEAHYPTSGQVWLTTWNNDSAQHDVTASTDVVKFSPSFSAQSDYRTVSFKLPNPRSASRRLRVEWTTEKFVGFTIEGTRLSGSERNLATERA